MLPIADQTAGPNGLKFFVDTHWWAKRNSKFKKKLHFLINSFLPRATPGTLASIY